MYSYINKFFFDKFYNKNVQVIPRLESISLSFINKDKDIVFLGVSALNLITKIKPSLLTKRLSKRRNARSELIGCQVLLKKKHAINFFNYLNLIVFSNYSDFTGLEIRRNLVNNNFIHITIADFLIFPELSREVGKFYQLKNLLITLHFKNDDFSFFNELNNFPIKR